MSGALLLQDVNKTENVFVYIFSVTTGLLTGYYSG